MLRETGIKLLRGVASVGRLAAAPRLRRRNAALGLVAYRGFGDHRRVCFLGRVSEDMGADDEQLGPHPQRRMLRRLRDAYRLLVSRPAPNARVEIEYQERRWHATTDEDGLFLICRELPGLPAEPLWQPYRVRLMEPVGTEKAAAEDRSHVLIRTARAARLIISDLDDTVIYTGVANKLAMLWRLFAASASEREPFPGAAAFYRALHRGAGENEDNPILYVSRSPWSIYPVLEEFFRIHGIPAGPVLLLRDWGITYRNPLPRRAPEHKQAMVDTALEVYDDLPVVLIGDSGQHDPEVYAQIAQQHPGRVSAIYIRDLEQSRRRTQELAAIGEDLRTQGVEFTSGPDSVALAAAAASHGWISAAALREVRESR